MLAPIYVRLGRRRSGDRLSQCDPADGSSAIRESGLGEAIAGAAGGVVSSEARAAFNRALELDPKKPKAMFYLATALAQDGKPADAVAAWQAMLGALPADSPWRGADEQAIAEAGAAPASGANRLPAIPPTSMLPPACPMQTATP